MRRPVQITLEFPKMIDKNSAECSRLLEFTWHGRIVNTVCAVLVTTH